MIGVGVSFAGTRLSLAMTVEAKDARELLVLDGDQSANVIRIAPGYLPESYSVATAIYAKGKPKFVLPPFYRVASDGDGWWTVARRRTPQVFEWTGAGKDGKWDAAVNWRVSGLSSQVKNTLVPSRLDTVKLVKDATIDMGRDRVVSNIVFSARVILAGGAVHARNTLGRGADGKLGVRAGSILGRVSVKEGAVVAPLRGKAGYKGVVEEDASGVSRVVLTRPPAVYVWSGLGGDGAWGNEKNWLINGRAPIEPPTAIDQVVFSRKERKDRKGKENELVVRLPVGWTCVSNLVTEVNLVWQGGKSRDALGEDGGNSSLDILDLSGNESFTVCGKDTVVCVKGASEVPIRVKSGSTLALAAHGHKPYRSVTLDAGATLVPYDWTVEIDTLVFKGANTVRFWPPRHFNRWRPLWVVHAKHLEGSPSMTTDDMTHWGQKVDRLNDGSSMIMVHYK